MEPRDRRLIFLLDLCLIHQLPIIGDALGAGFIFLVPLRMVFLYESNKIFIGFHMHQCMVFMHDPAAYLTSIFCLSHGLIITWFGMSSIYQRGGGMSRSLNDSDFLPLLWEVDGLFQDVEAGFRKGLAQGRMGLDRFA